MENFIIYLIKASGLLAVFYIAYYTLLRKETFFYSNRKFLLAGLITSAIFPLLVLTRTIWVEAAPQAAMQEMSIAQLMAIQQQMEANVAKSINWYSITGFVYVAGVLFFLIRFYIDIKAIVKMLRGKEIVYKNGFKYIDSEAVQSPFSFFNYIVYNSIILSPQELQNILSHEKVHSAQKHSFDMIISQLFCIAFWFNPFVWAYRKAVSQNLEFIADAEATKEIEDIKSYQKTLLKITVQPECTVIINHFYQSLIKKRIVMLNKKQSKTRNSWKYAVVVPALVAFMFCFQLKVTAQEKAPETKIAGHQSLKKELKITKDSKNEELEAQKDLFKKEFDADVTFSNITRNEKDEITGLKIVVKDANQSRVYESSGQIPIKPFTVEVEKDDKGNQEISFGVTSYIRAKGNVKLHQSNDSIIRYTSDEEIRISDNRIRPKTVSSPNIKHIAPPAPLQGNWSVNNIAIDNKDMLIVINGVKQEKGESIKLPLNTEIDKMNFLDKKDAKKKYGKDGKKGAVEITTKKVTSRYSVHTIENNGTSKISIGNSGIDYDDMHADIAAMRQFANIDFENITSENINQFKMLRGMTKEDITALKKRLGEAQLEIQKIRGIDGNADAFRFNEEQFAEARRHMAEAREQLASKREELSVKRELINEKRRKHIEEMNEKRQLMDEEREVRKHIMQEQNKAIQEE
ncbi:M56 family peptidase [Flavobacterium salilacus subsp. salilacus]|uniref:M56 family metallopeptidase n=1 Tax=Flavobacterium TaxID=237 RepID=UPI001074F5FD|nr:MULTISPECIES: M56 family metallopeptidase [Flavobacterium]KAF2518730.1 M56 family peptidase [Flavobacterium salilacus subsp. salilacus]MBE1613696.1 M56 family peptidase [Flavobacterium sp. SaA2.13]